MTPTHVPAVLLADAVLTPNLGTSTNDFTNLIVSTASLSHAPVATIQVLPLLIDYKLPELENANKNPGPRGVDYGVRGPSIVTQQHVPLCQRWKIVPVASNFDCFFDSRHAIKLYGDGERGFRLTIVVHKTRRARCFHAQAIAVVLWDSR